MKGSGDGVRKRSVGVRAWARLGLEKTVVEAVEEQDDALVISVRPSFAQRDRCPHCRRRCPGYGLGEGRRRWRALDLGTTFCFLEADAPRVECRQHGVVVAAVPWARHDAGFTRSLDDTAAWLTVNTSKSAICQLLRIAWRTVGRICERVSAEAKAGRDLFANLTELGFDEISIRKGQKYLTVVIDHHTGRLVWAAFGRDRKTVEKFLDLLGSERCQQIRLISCDDADWITCPISERCPNAIICLDPWHMSRPRPTRSTTCAARSGTRRAAPATSSSPNSSKAPGSRYETAGEPDRAPTTQARVHPRSSTPRSTAPTCSKNSFARSTTPPVPRTRSRCSTPG